jgi:hypothetical protein
LAAIFFSNDIEDYTIDKRRYPSFLTEIYCETSDQLIDFEKPYYTFLDFNYQFYSLKTIDRKLNETYSYQNVESGYAFTKSNDSIITYYYKDTLVDVSNYIKTPQASYKNYSATFYKNEPIENYNYYSNYNYSGDYDYNYQKLNYSKQALLSSQTTQELLENNNPKQIKQLLNDFLAVAKKHEIEHNISTNEWFQLIYHPTDFEVKSLIRTEKKTYHYENTDYEKTESETFNINNTTDFYIRTGDLSNVFENIETIKSNPVIGETIHIFIWIAFFLASVIFVFRITGLKSLLFSIITVGLLSIFIALITTLVYFISGSYGENSIQFFISYFVFILSTFILAIPIFFASKLKKQIVAICLNISIVGFVLYVFLIIGIISIHQDHYCRNIYDYTYDCPILITSIGLYLSYVLLASGLVFLYFYTSIIKQWKALPEG